MSVPIDNKIYVKDDNRISKYKDLGIDNEKMWHLKTTTVPVIVGALGNDQERDR